MEYSISPEGEKFQLPGSNDYEAEYERLDKIVAQKRKEGYEIVVVVGVGFVGAVMGAIIADSVDKKTGKPGKFVIGMQRPSTRSYWKIPYLNRGIAPVKAEDPEVEPMIRRCVQEKETLIATFTGHAFTLADVIVVDVQCDYIKESIGDISTGYTDMASLEKSLRVIGEKMPPEALVLIETTVAPGTTEFVALPILKEEFKKRGIETEPLLAHSYERVMPGRNYIGSIRDFWRVCSGVNEESKKKVAKFLNEVLNTDKFPLTVLDRPIESETAKIVENSYRATMLAFLDEWSLFAEQNGIDLIKVINAIKVRPTHNNIIFPGPGIGGYCLPKDGALGIWAHKNILGTKDNIFKMTGLAININDTRALHVAELVKDALEQMGKNVVGAKILLLGAAYREDVGDTRYSGSELIVRKLTEMGAEMLVHDPYIQHWWEFEQQDTYPSPGHSLARFFKNQDNLKNLKVQNDLNLALKDVDGVIFAVKHSHYLHITPKNLVEMISKPAAIIDCFGILEDAKIKEYLKLNCVVKGLGRGHIERLKEK
ncbi:MAG: nucleotide sugar dehydrogenase [bacterium]|nr:nucleotide sugar dehydrogenase [bacterium]